MCDWERTAVNVVRTELPKDLECEAGVGFYR